MAASTGQIIVEKVLKDIIYLLKRTWDYCNLCAKNKGVKFTADLVDLFPGGHNIPDLLMSFNNHPLLKAQLWHCINTLYSQQQHPTQHTQVFTQFERIRPKKTHLDV